MIYAADAVRNTANEYLVEFGWSIIPLVGKIPPAGFRLAEYFNRQPTESELDEWFGGGITNLGIVHGDVSDGLRCRDFDDADAYHRWTASQPRLAARCPTVRTRRGYHVYFAADDADVRILHPRGGRIIACGDGELRGGCSYTVAPPSVVDGHRYEWIVPPVDVPFIGNLESSGLVPATTENCTQATAHKNGLCAIYDLEAEEHVQIAIVTTQPSGPGWRNRCLLQLAGALKSVPGIRDVQDVDALRPIVQRWHQAALPRIRTKAFRETWDDFRWAWENVRHAKWSHVGALAEGATGDGIDKLADICRILQSQAGEKPFFLDCRTAAVVCGCSVSTAGAWLRKLCQRGVIQLVEKGSRAKRRASTYRYVRESK